MDEATPEGREGGGQRESERWEGSLVSGAGALVRMSSQEEGDLRVRHRGEGGEDREVTAVPAGQRPQPARAGSHDMRG